MREANYPTLTRWLARTSPRHLWRTWLATEAHSDATHPSIEDAFLIPLEDMASVIEAADPPGLAAFLRDKLGKDEDLANVNGTRLEIACAASLAAAGVRFRFGGDCHPDFTWTIGDGEGSVEVTRKAVDDFDKLLAAVDQQLVQEGLDVQVTCRIQKWPLRVGARNLLQTRIVEAARRAAVEGSPSRASLDELEPGASVECHVRQPGGEPAWRPSTEHGSLDPAPAYLADLASKLHRVLEEEKGGQSRRDGWSLNVMLLVDISSAQHALLLGDDGLRTWFSTIELDWNDLPFSAFAVGFTRWDGVGLRGLYRMRPGVLGNHAKVLAIGAAGLGLQPVDTG
jgi:hypothetical protein